MREDLHFGESGNEREQLQARYTLAFDSSCQIFDSPQATREEFDEDIQEKRLVLSVDETSVLYRMGIEHLSASYVEGAEHGEPDVIVVDTSRRDGSLVTYTLLRDSARGEDSLSVEVAEGEDSVEYLADNHATLEYLATLQAIKAQLKEYVAPVVLLRPIEEE